MMDRRLSADDLTRCDVLALLGRELRVEGELGHPEDAIHGCPDLVTHRGEERRLGLIRDLGRLPERLIQSPRHQAHGAGRQHEHTVDTRPQPRMRLCGGVIVDGARGQHTGQTVMGNDIRDGEKEGNPVLVKSHHSDHHEEVEVRLDVASGDVDEYGRAGDESKARERGAQAPTSEGAVGHQRQNRDCSSFKEMVGHVAPTGQGECCKSDEVEPEQDDHAPVPALPDLGWKAPAFRQHLPHGAHDRTEDS